VFSLACFSLIVVGFLILRYQTSYQPPAAAAPESTPGPQPTHTVSYVQITGLGQYQQANAEAQAWAADAQLVAASAHWPRVIYEDQIGEPGEWTYRFYSPEKQRLFNTKVRPDGSIFSFEHVVMITLAPPLLDTGEWSIDSPAALSTWLDYGGAELVRRNPGLEILIQLRSLPNHPAPVWSVIGSDKRTQDIHIVIIDANTGDVVSTNTDRG
jgi:hypothetical protein